MVTPAEVRRMVEGIAGSVDTSDDRRLAFAVAVTGKGFAWSFNERVHPKKPRVPRLDILAVRCPFERKALLLEAAPDRFFDDDHYRGFPAVLVRLPAIEEDELAALFRDAWDLAAPKPKTPRKTR